MLRPNWSPEPDNRQFDINNPEQFQPFLKSYMQSHLCLISPACRFDTISKVNLLLNADQNAVLRTITIQHMDQLIGSLQSSGVIFQYNVIEKVLELYQLLLMKILGAEGYRIYPNNIQTIFDHGEFFLEMVRRSPGSGNKASLFVKFMLACSRNNCKLFVFPEIVIELHPYIDEESVFGCLNQFLQCQQSYNLGPYYSQICSIFQEKLQKFVDSNKFSATQGSAIELTNFFNDLLVKICLSKIQQRGPLPFLVYLTHNKFAHEDFNLCLLTFLKKTGNQSFLQIWIKRLIDFGHLDLSFHLVEMVLYYYISSAENFRILDLMADRNWSSEWFKRMLRYNFIGYVDYFLNEDPYCFLLLTKLMQCHSFQNDIQFIQIMNVINYDSFLRKFIHKDTVREQAIQLLSNNIDPEDFQEMWAMINDY